MIYVLDLSRMETNDLSGKEIFCGEWFYYYGNGEYGFTPEKGDEVFVGRYYNKTPAKKEDINDKPVIP